MGEKILILLNKYNVLFYNNVIPISFYYISLLVH